MRKLPPKTNLFKNSSVRFHMTEDLLCSVKGVALTENGKIICSVFMLRDIKELTGRTLSQYRLENRVGAWKVESYNKDLVLERIDGISEIEPCDTLHIELEASPVSVVETHIEQALVFSGKNWKLASEKKWTEKTIDVTGFEKVGETKIRGKAYHVLKGPDVFAAVKIRENTPIEGTE